MASEVCQSRCENYQLALSLRDLSLLEKEGNTISTYSVSGIAKNRKIVIVIFKEQK